MSEEFGSWMEDAEAAFGSADDVRSETGGGNYVSLKNDGDEAIIVVQGPATAFRTVWLNGRSEIYDPKNEDHEGQMPKGRFNWPVALKAGEKSYESKIFESSGETYDVLKEALKEYGADTVFKLRRKGTGLDTKYSCLFARKLEGGELDHVAGLEPIATEPGAGNSDSEPDDLPEAGDSPWG